MNFISELHLMEIFSYPFMQRALIVAIATGTVCAVLSCFLVLKGWSLMGDAISHAVLPGIVLSFMLKIPLGIGATMSGLFCAIGTGYIKENSRLKEDTVLGILFSGLFALGIVLFSFVDTNLHLTHILLGDLLGTTQQEMIQSIAISSITLFIILIKFKDLALYCFDSQYIKLIGLPVNTLRYTLLIILSLTIVASLQVVGSILVIAMLITPGITGYILTHRFTTMVLIAVISTITACCLGTIISFIIDGATAPCIVIIQAFIFVLSQLFVSLKGYFMKKLGHLCS